MSFISLKRVIGLIFVLMFFATVQIQAAASCTSPTATLNLNNTLTGQKIDKPYINGFPSSGESLYYKINITNSGTLVLRTNIDSTNSSDNVDTFAQLLDSNCAKIEDVPMISNNPRLVKEDKALSAGTYYLKVYNEINIDGGSENAKGYFQLENSFTQDLASYNISFWRDNLPSVSSGASFVQHFYIKNSGSTSTSSVKVTIPSYTPSGHLTFISNESSTNWSCDNNDPMVCTLNSGTIATNETKELQLKYKADYQTYDRTVSNTATADITFTDSNTTQKTKSYSVLIRKETPGIRIRELPSSTTVIQDDTFTYTWQVDNNGTLADENVTVVKTIGSDFTIAGGLNYDSSVWKNCTLSGKDISCELINPLQPNQSQHFSLSVKATGDPANPETLKHEADVYGDTLLGHVSDSSYEDVTIIAKTFEPHITNVASSSSVIVGHSAYYTLTVSNSGNSALSNVRVTDLIPSNLKLTSLSLTSGWDCSASDTSTNSVDCTLSSDLGAGSSKVLQINVDGKTVGNDINNTATMSSSEASDVSSWDTINVIAATPSIKIVKDAPETVDSVHKFYYTFDVTNDGSEVDSNITLSDTFDSQLVLDSDWNDAISSPWSCSKSGQNVTCSYTSNLNPGQNATQLLIKVKAPYVTENTNINNSVDIDAIGSGTSVHDSSSVSIQINKPTIGILLEKSASSSTINSAANFVYTIKVDNNGSLDESDVKVIDDLPTELDGDGVIDPSSDADFDCSASSGKHIECTLASLPSGTQKYLKIKVKAPIVTSNTTLRNDATSTAKIIVPGDLDTTTTASGHVNVTIIPPASNLSIQKDVSKDIILEKDLFDYSIKIRNNSIADEQNLTLTDDVPHEFSIKSISASGWSCSSSGNLVTCKLNTLLANTQAQDINISVKAPNTISTQSTVTNSATIKSVKESIGKSDQADVTLVPNTKALTMHISSNPPTVYAGDEYYYKIFMSNNSGRDIDDINITDILPADVTYVRYESGGWNCSYDNGSRKFACDNNGTKFTAGNKEIYLYVTAPSYETNVTDTASIVSNLSDVVIDDNVTTAVLGKKADLSYQKMQVNPSSVKINEPFVYTVAVKNTGVAPSSDINATDINVTFTLDDNLSISSYSGVDWNCTQNGQEYSCIYSKALDLGEITSDINVTLSSNTPGQKITYLTTTASQMQSAVSDSLSVDVKDVVHTDLSITLDDSVDPVDALDSYSYTVTVNNPHVSKSIEGIAVDINTTSSDNYTWIDYSDTSVWSCTHSAYHVHCLLKNDLPKDSNTTLTLNVKAPNSATTIDLNASVSSEYVVDSDSSNNHTSESTDIFYLNISGNNPRNFTKVPILGNEDTNIFGDIITIGNQSICQKDKLHKECHEPSQPNNDLITQEYINLDSTLGSGYKNATNASFSINADDEILWAGLYWMGRVVKNQSGATSKMKAAHKIYFRHQSDSQYHQFYSENHAQAIDNNGTSIYVDKFNYINSSDYFDYQGMVDVTSYVKAHRDGTYWVADVQSSEGDNLSAGWNLVVIVLDKANVPTRHLKNITIFDGFLGVWKSPADSEYPDEVSQSVSGFLTPANGLIDSSLSIFAFEGDRIFGDKIQISDNASILHDLSNANNPKLDVVNGTISKYGSIMTNRVPSLSNTSGIDIDQFYLGDVNGTLGSGIIKNNQTSTDIKIASEGDRFFLGMFAFSTSLYDPVCYNQKILTPDFSQPISSEVHLGDEIGIEVEFKNKEIQNLENFKALTDIDTILRDDNTSFELKNIDNSGHLETSFSKQDNLFHFSKIDVGDANQTEVIVNAGQGSNASDGGKLAPSNSIFFRYKAIVDDFYDENKTHSIYKALYAPANKKVMVPPCGVQTDFPTVKKNNVNGFAITHPNGTSIDGILDGYLNGDTSTPSNENNLFTQVADTNFSIDIAILDDTNNKILNTNPYKGILKLDIVDNSDSSKTCAQYPVIGSNYISMNSIVSSQTLSYHTANKSVAFRASYLVDKYGKYISWSNLADSLSTYQNILQNSSFGDNRCKSECIISPNLNSCKECLYKSVDNGGLSKFTCSLDTFAIKPKEISIDVNTTLANLKGGKTYQLDFNASFASYDQLINTTTGSVNQALVVPSGCSLSSSNSTILPSGGLSFNGGVGSIGSYSFPNVGDVNISFTDHTWTILDQNQSDENLSDCVVGSSSNVPNAQGKVGCNIASDKLLHFVPDSFKNNITIQDFNGSGFVYLSPGDSHMASTIAMQTTAMLANGNIATNYTNGCFSKDVNYQFSFSNPTIPATAGGIIYFDDSNATSSYNGTLGDFNTTKNHFANGVANMKVLFNFNKNATTPLNPFAVNKNDFNITGIVDSSGVSGSDFNRSVNEHVDFYYGRLHMPDITVDNSTCTMPLYYEIYCKDCNKSRYTLANNPESVDSVNWYTINSIHTSPLLGTHSIEHTNNGVQVVDATPLQSIDLSLNGIKAPHIDKVVLTPSSWLLYNPFSAAVTTTSGNVDFTSAARVWGGKGKLGYTVDSNISKRDIKKMEW